jgi:prolyl oligopeptidase
VQRVLAACALALLSTPLCAWAADPADPADPYIWLETLKNDRVDAWIAAENAKTVAVLEQDPRYPAIYDEALAIAEAKDRIQTPSFWNGSVFNFWQDAEHIRGIWRRTTLDDYRTAQPNWSTVLDLDELSRLEKENWVWKAVDCQRPDENLCLIYLSDGGEDAVTVREFDIRTNHFVPNGFVLPKSKQAITRAAPDALLVARDWGAGTMTKSGYPYVVKLLKRGQKLAAARELFRGKPSDLRVNPIALRDGDGHQALLIQRKVSYFESETWLLRAGKPVRLSLPPKARVTDLVAGRLLVELEQDWTSDGKSFAQGSLVALDLAAARKDPAHLIPSLVYAPGPRDSLSNIATTRSHLIVNSYTDVKGRAAIYTPTKGGGWTSKAIDLPDNSSIYIVDTDDYSENAFLTVTGFLTPPTLSLVDAASGETTPLKSLPARFDASKDIVEQHEAVSKDGTRIPYFVVHPAELDPNGQNPTILFAYGGFQISKRPYYLTNIGKLWLEKGGSYVLANIRGGGEFGPAWHEAGLKTHRQVIYDDFAAVAEDLIERKLTVPRRLGIEGGSNGGLLMGVEFNQHPDLWSAVYMQVPLLDMLRFEQIAAGSSWVDEYGTVDKPEERAFLASISPYANLRRDVTYPEPFLWTTTNDDRVGPQHARKFAARLAEFGKPYFFYEATEGGHGSGANLEEEARTVAMDVTYFARKLMD